MSETLEPVLLRELDEKADLLMKAGCTADLLIATAERCTGGLLEMLEAALENE